MDWDPKKLFKEMKEIKSWEAKLQCKEYSNHQQKCSVASAQVRAEGNQLFNKKNHSAEIHERILSLYTKSIALAIESSEEQALAYSNRSVILMHLRKYKKCLIDIKRAYEISQSNELKKKLDLRKEKCLILLKSEDKNKENKNYKDDFTNKPANFTPVDVKSFQSMAKVLLGYEIPHEVAIGLDFIRSPEFISSNEKCKKLKLPTLEKSNNVFPNLSDCVTVKYNKKYGRHIVATRDIRPGEILSIEDGFVFPPLDRIYSVCSYCLEFMWTGIPCTHCVYAVYCTENCRSKAWQEYHDVECLMLPQLMNFTAPNFESNLLTLRLFIMLVKTEGLKNMIDQAKSIDNDKYAFISGFLTNGKLDPSRFRAYYNMLSHDEDQHCKQVNNFGSLGTFLLMKYTQIFKDYDDPTLNESIICVETKKLLMKFRAVVHLGAVMVQDITPMMDYLSDFTAMEVSDKSIGVMINPCSSLFNHSCISNACIIFCKNKKKIIFSEQPIKKNAQVFVSYTVNLQMPLIQRQLELKTTYHFSCECEACIDDWIVQDNDSTERFMKNLSTNVKIFKEHHAYREKIKNKKVDHLSLLYAIKFIELAFKYLSNYDAFFFYGEYINYLQKVLYKIYGAEISIPNACF